MTQCVYPHETGKVFAMLASVESLVPILASSVFTHLYNATSGLPYPWPGSFYFAAGSCALMGIFVTLYVYISVGFGTIPAFADLEETEDEVQNKPSLQRASSNSHPEDDLSKRQELFCVSFNAIPG